MNHMTPFILNRIIHWIKSGVLIEIRLNWGELFNVLPMHLMVLPTKDYQVMKYLSEIFLAKMHIIRMHTNLAPADKDYDKCIKISWACYYVNDQTAPSYTVCASVYISRVSASMQGQERLSHIDAMHSQFTLLLHLRGYIHFSYLHTRSRLFG